MASIAKRAWQAADGPREAWVVRYFDPEGAHRSRQFATRKEAATFRCEAEQVEKAKEADPALRTVGEVAAEYLKVAARRVTEGRMGRQRHEALGNALRRHVLGDIGVRPMAELKAEEIERLYEGMLAGGSMIPRTARVYIHNLKMVEDHARRRQYITTTPVADFMRELPDLPREAIRTFTVAEVQRLLDMAGQRPPRAHARPAAVLNCFVHLAALCGLRRGEIGALTRASVDLDGRVLEVRHSLTRYRTLKSPKTQAGVREVPLPGLAAKVLREWIARFWTANPADLLFTGRNGAPMSGGAELEGWPGLLERAGLGAVDRSFHFHALRHFYASVMIEAGTPLADAAILLGHSTFDRTLRTYTHSVLEHPSRHAFADAMMDRFAPSDPPILPA